MPGLGKTGATGARPVATGLRIGGMALLLAVAGCAAEVHSPSLFADPGGAAVALDSIEGPPSAIFQRFVRDLNEEAQARQIAVVPRGERAPYRLRGYLAAHTVGHKTSIAWVWDIYDTAERRAFRLTGEEAGTTARKSWAAADEQVLRRIARVSVEQLAVFLATARPPASPANPPPTTVASRSLLLPGQLDDFRPEASGIFRIFQREASEAEAGAGGMSEQPRADEIPLPPDRPAPPLATPGAFAYSDPASE